MPAAPVEQDELTLSDLIERVAQHGDRLTLQRDGRDAAALVCIEDLELLRRIEDEADLAEARESLAEAAITGTIPWKHVKSDRGL